MDIRKQIRQLSNAELAREHANAMRGYPFDVLSNEIVSEAEREAKRRKFILRKHD